MADRYWVGGTGLWDSDAAANGYWSTTSGGPGGASNPTSGDDVYFDAASGTGTVTLVGTRTCARTFFTGFTGTFTGSSTPVLSTDVLVLSAGMTLPGAGNISFSLGSAGTYPSGTLTSAGKTLAAVTINSSGGTVTLLDPLTVSGTLTVTQGTFNTGNANVTADRISSSNSNARTINLGSSTVTLSNSTPFVFTTATNLTFNAGTSQVNLTNSTANLSVNGQMFYNVAFTSTVAGTRVITGASTFNNLSVTAPSSTGVAQLTFDSNQVINGTLLTTGTTGNRRVWFSSNTYGVRRTLTVNSAPSLTDADFRDIIVNGTAAPISGTRIGNRGACSGITFSVPKTVYWNLSGAQNWSANGWAATSGGTPSTDNFPLPQDTAVFNNTGSVTGNITLDTAIGYVPTVDMSARTSAMTLNVANTTTIYGSWLNGSGTTLSGTSVLTFSGEGTKTINGAGKTFSFPITIDAFGGNVELANNFTSNSRNITVTRGSFDTKNYDIDGVSIFSSNNSNIRSIKLGSSSLQIQEINFTDTTNLTFDAGTSSIEITYFGGSTALAGTGLTFYNVSIGTSNNSTTHIVQGPNTFNSLDFRDPGVTGYVNYTITGNLTTGTLTSTGTSVSSRVFLSSDTVGVPRVLTASTMSMGDCDFEDITIAGSAAGTSVTRGGDCGGNSGITFPAPKTVYRVGTNTTWVGSSSWALTSGGTGANNNLPLAQDVAVIDNNTALTGTLTLGTSTEFNIGSIDCSTRTTGITLSYDINSIFTVHKDFILSSAVTVSGSGAMWFSGTANQIFESAGKTIPFGITVNKAAGELQLGSALTATTSIDLRSGTFNASGYNVTVPAFLASNATNPRTLKMGAGLWTLTATGTVWDAATSTNFILLKETADILLSNTSTSARTFAGGGLSYNKLTIGGTTGTSTLTISGNNIFTELASTKTVAHTIALAATAQNFGKWSVTGTAGNVVTLTGTGTSHILAGSATSGIDYLAMGSIGFAATSPGEFYAGANSTGTAGAPVFRTATPASRTLYWVGGTGNWNDTARWSLSSGGTGGAAVPRSMDNVVFNSASNATAYTVTVNTITGGNRCNALTIAGPASGNVTLAGTTNLICHDNVTLPSSGLSLAYDGGLILSGSTSGKTITTNGKAFYQGITIHGMGSEWSLGSDFSVTAVGGVSLIAGSFNTNNYNLSVNTITTSGARTRSMSLGSSTVYIANGALDFSNNSPNFTFDAGTSTLQCGGTLGGGYTFYNVEFVSGTIAGNNTFNNLIITGHSNDGLKNITLSGNQTVNGTFTINSSGLAHRRNFILSDTLGTPRTVTCASFSSAEDCDFRDITIAGAPAPISGTRLGDCGGNSGITFPSPKTVYWRLTTGNAWYATAWSTSVLGTADAASFPLPQDTAVFSSRPNSGSTITLDLSYNIGTIDMSNRTSSTMTLNISVAPTIYGNWINGTGTTLSNTGTITFAGRGSQTITSAGKPFSQTIRFSNVGGSVTLQDAFVTTRTSSAAVFFDTGTFNANSYNVTIGGLSSNVTTTRTLGVGSGTWVLNDSGILWSINATNLTVTGTGTISITSTSGKTFAGGGANYSGITLNQGGTGTLTITGNNTFANITNTATGATIIALGTTTQRVGAFTAKGTAGNVLTITGNTSNLVYTGGGSINGLDYMNIQGRAFGPTGQITDVWYAGANSVNSGSFGWTYEGALALTAGNFLFLLL